MRGNWRRTDQSTFMLLAKSCHDIDWLQYVVGRPVRKVASFGGLKHFRPENRPEGGLAMPRLRRRAGVPVLGQAALLRPAPPGAARMAAECGHPAFTEEALTGALRHGRYGRCVYDCDNDVVDHQVVAMEFEGGATGTFTMTAFTTGGHRRTRIFGTHGELMCDGEHVEVKDFRTGESSALAVTAGGDPTAGGGHAGGDERLMAAFVAAVATGDRSLVRSGPSESLASHLAVFAAERARLTDQIVTVEQTPPHERNSPMRAVLKALLSTFFSLALLLGPVPAHADTPDPGGWPKPRFLSYNVCGAAKHCPPIYQNSVTAWRDMVVRSMDHWDADLVMLQEVCYEQWTLLRNHLAIRSGGPKYDSVWAAARTAPGVPGGTPTVTPTCASVW
ncbi:Gfo/Idh/MocA family oxidoreductase [Nonomuraea thailandensis]